MQSENVAADIIRHSTTLSNFDLAASLQYTKPSPGGKVARPSVCEDTAGRMRDGVQSDRT